MISISGLSLIKIKYLDLFKALLARLILLLIWAYYFLSKFALLSLCYKKLIFSFNCSVDINSKSFEFLKFPFWSFNVLSCYSMFFLSSSSLLILSKRFFLMLVFSLNSRPYLERALNPLFLLSLLLLIRNFCSSISFFLCS